MGTSVSPCLAASEALGESVQYCAQGARQGLYDLEAGAYTRPLSGST